MSKNEFKELVEIKCKELEIEIIAIECDKDHSHMFLNCLPTLVHLILCDRLKDIQARYFEKNFLSCQRCRVYGQGVILYRLLVMFAVKQLRSM